MSKININIYNPCVNKDQIKNKTKYTKNIYVEPQANIFVFNLSFINFKSNIKVKNDKTNPKKYIFKNEANFSKVLKLQTGFLYSVIQVNGVEQF